MAEHKCSARVLPTNDRLEVPQSCRAFLRLGWQHQIFEKNLVCSFIRELLWLTKKQDSARNRRLERYNTGLPFLLFIFPFCHCCSVFCRMEKNCQMDHPIKCCQLVFGVMLLRYISFLVPRKNFDPVEHQRDMSCLIVCYAS